jgi:serine/threonine protein kinase
MNQIGGGVCSLCKSPGTNKVSCPMNPDAKNPNHKTHPLAGKPTTLPKSVAKVPDAPAPQPQPKPVATPAPQSQPKPIAAPQPQPKPATPAPQSQPKPATPAPQPQPKPATPAPQPQPKPVSTPATHVAKPTEAPVGLQGKVKVKIAPVPLPVAPRMTSSLQDAYTTTRGRVAMKNQIEALIRSKDVSQCLSGQLDKYFTLGKRIGSGTFGVVHAASVGDYRFAVKEASTSRSVLTHPWSEKTGWSEALILRNIAKPIIERSMCPNVPLIYGAYSCATCEFEGLNSQKKKAIKPCIVVLVELASGDFSSWLRSRPTEPEIYNALFQILAGLYALQKIGQVFNNDIKAPNILYYDVTPGGYWIYNILGTQYQVPNIGKLFVINDFGVSSALSPDFMYSYAEKHYSLGRRIYTISNNKIVPFGSDLGDPEQSMSLYDSPIRTLAVFNANEKKIPRGIQVHLSPEQTELLARNGLPTNPNDLRFYSNIDILPPQEFVYDTHDVLATFIGGIARSTQSGKHVDYAIPDNVKAVLRQYMMHVPRDGSRGPFYRKPMTIHPALVHAGYLINDLYGNKNIAGYLAPLPGAPLEVYTI